MGISVEEAVLRARMGLEEDEFGLNDESGRPLKCPNDLVNQWHFPAKQTRARTLGFSRTILS